MLKIVYPICCGMDVHKNFVVACITATDDKGVTAYKKKRFSTFTSDLRRCASWLAENNCTDVCMESTGKYWIPIYNTLESTCQIVLAHPKYVKAIRGKKTDEKDAKWIADIFKHGLVSGSFIPPVDIRQPRSNAPGMEQHVLFQPDLATSYWLVLIYVITKNSKMQHSFVIYWQHMLFSS